MLTFSWMQQQADHRERKQCARLGSVSGDASALKLMVGRGRRMMPEQGIQGVTRKGDRVCTKSTK